MGTRVFGIELGSPLAIKPSLKKFWRWWIAELLAVLPERLRQKVHLGPERLVLTLVDNSVTVSREDFEGTQLLQRYSRGPDVDDQEIAALVRSWVETGYEPIIKLPANRVLSKTIDLPLAVAENLRQVLGFEMDRYTPFKAEQVYYDFRVLDRQTAQRRLRVALFIAPRQLVDDSLARLAEWGVHPVAVESEQDSSINLLPPEKRLVKRGLTLNLNRALMALACLLLAAAVVMPLWEMRGVVVTLNQRLADANRAAQGVEALRAERNSLLEETRFLIDKKQSRPPVIEIMDELTRILPDTTWLLNFQLNGDNLVIQGESPASSELIEIIEASPYFYGTSFRAPVTKNPRSGLEGFQISTQIVPAKEA